MSFNVDQFRAEFPILSRQVHGKPLVYFDTGASSQKPKAVIDAMNRYYEQSHANVHRGVHELSQAATDEYEAARDKVAAWIGANRREEVIITRGTTESLNMIAQTWGRQNVVAGDRLLVSESEHHANLVPWQMLAQEKGAQLVKIPLLPNGELCQASFTEELARGAKLVAVSAVSNALGTVNPAQAMATQAKKAGAVVVIDGAQEVPHSKVNLAETDYDFYVFSAHKLYGPTGIGILWGRFELLDTLPPWHGGGDMIEWVTFESSTYNVLPFRLEAGTPSIAEGIGLGATIDWLNTFDFEAAAQHEQSVYNYARERLKVVDGLRLVGESDHASGAISFVIDGLSALDLGTLLDQQGIAVRTGHHCAMPALQAMGVDGTVRVSLGFYNTQTEIDQLIEGLDVAVGMLA